MTKSAKSLSKASKNRMSAGQVLFCLMSAVAMMLTFRYSEEVVSAMSSGMSLCVTTVIPSLFPFMVLSELFISSGAGELMGRYIGRPLSALFGISHAGAAALLIGFICGFPIGTRSAVSLYERGRISRAEFEHLCTFCNNPSSAFLISAVGGALFGSRLFGVLLYASHILSSCIVGFIGRFLFVRGKDSFCEESCSQKKREGIIASFIRAVTDSASSMLFICAFVVFFSAVVGVIRSFARGAGLPNGAMALMFGFFEMTGGVAEASALPLGLAIPISAAITGWSGLSVHFQFVSICKEHRFALRPYFLSKALCALLNMVIISILVRVAGDRIIFSGGSISSFLMMSGGIAVPLSLAAFLAGCAVLRLQGIRGQKNNF